jgi:hypothetical protein
MINILFYFFSVSGLVAWIVGVLMYVYYRMCMPANLPLKPKL